MSTEPLAIASSVSVCQCNQTNLSRNVGNILSFPLIFRSLQMLVQLKDRMTCQIHCRLPTYFDLMIILMLSLEINLFLVPLLFVNVTKGCGGLVMRQDAGLNIFFSLFK